MVPRLSRIAVQAMALALSLAACESPARLTTPRTSGPEARADISDAAHGGTAHFYWLPPLVPQSTYSGVPDGTRSPEVVICDVGAARPAANATCGAIIADFTMTSGTGSQVIRYDATAGQYIVNWQTDQCATPSGGTTSCTLSTTDFYRVIVRATVSGIELGHADIDPVSSASDLHNYTTGDAIPLVNGRTLPVKFRIEVGAPTVSPHLLVSDASGLVLSFAPGANGNATPSSTLGGPTAGTGFLTGMDRDAAGNLYAADISASVIHVFAPGATGDVAAIRTIAGPSTGLYTPIAVVVDGSGTTYTANQYGSTVTAYAAGASGDASPMRVIGGPNTGLNQPWGLALDASGNLYVGDIAAGAIRVFAPGANGDVAPIRTIAGPSTGITAAAGLTFDLTGNLYVADIASNTILVFAPGASGDAAPSRSIGGPSTGLVGPSGIAISPSGLLYVANQFGGTITAYQASASGDAAPVVTLGGGNTGITQPVFVLF